MENRARDTAMAIPLDVSSDRPAGSVIRAATASDVAEIVAIWGELALHHAQLDEAFAPSARWQEEYRQFIRTLIGRDDALAVVAVEAGRVVGYGVGRISTLPAFFERRRRGYVHDVVTRQAYRRRGIGRRLVGALLEWMRGTGISLVELTVAVRNEEAVRFWQEMGFATYMHHMKRTLRS
jgi:ribosomal protein S18 acetylase RimI-like enzyme